MCHTCPFGGSHLSEPSVLQNVSTSTIHVLGPDIIEATEHANSMTPEEIEGVIDRILFEVCLSPGAVAFDSTDCLNSTKRILTSPLAFSKPQTATSMKKL